MGAWLRNACDHLDFEVETGKPIDAYSSPVGVGWIADLIFTNGHDYLYLVFRVGMKRGHVHHVLKCTPGSIQDCVQVIKGELNLAFEIWLRRSVFSASDLTGNEQQIARSDRC